LDVAGDFKLPALVNLVCRIAVEATGSLESAGRRQRVHETIR